MVQHAADQKERNGDHGFLLTPTTSLTPGEATRADTKRTLESREVRMQPMFTVNQ